MMRKLFTPYITIYLDWDKTIGKKDMWLDISHLFSLNLNYKSSARTRINIHLVEKKSHERTCVEGSIKSIWYYDEALAKSDLERIINKERVLEIIYKSFLLIAKEINLEIGQIKNAKEKCFQSNFTINYISKPKFSRNRKHKAAIRLQTEGLKAILSVVFFNKKSVIIHEIKIIETFLHNVTLMGYFDDEKWLNNENFGFSFCDDCLQIFASISSTKSYLNMNTEHLNSEKAEITKGLLRKLTYKEFKTEEERINWINQ